MNVLIFKVNQLGDNVVFLPIIQEFRARYPEWRLSLLTSPVAAPLYEKDIPAARTILMATGRFNGVWKRPWEFAELLVRARREQADASVLANDQGNVAHLLAIMAGGKIRAGVTPPFIRVRGSITRRMPAEGPPRAALLNWEIARTLVNALGGREWRATPPPPDLGHLAGGAVPVPGRIVIHPGASREYQRWFPERYSELANRLSRQFEVVWIEQEDTAAIPLDSAVNRIRTPSLRDLVKVLAGASMLVANNSGPMNLASALGLPSVIINGPSHYFWDPFWYSDRFLMLRDKSLPCLPCDQEYLGAGTCRNRAEPMACMKRWSVDKIHDLCRGWMEKWGTLAGKAPGVTAGEGTTP